MHLLHPDVDRLARRRRDLLDLARAIAKVAHGEQLDKAGDPYLGHLERVAGRCRGVGDPLAEVLAWLHDLVEDTPLRTLDLRHLFPPDVLDALEAITHRRPEPYVVYIERVARNPLARQVKIADLLDNLSAERLDLLDGATRARLLAKYMPALHRLTTRE